MTSIVTPPQRSHSSSAILARNDHSCSYGRAVTSNFNLIIGIIDWAGTTLALVGHGIWVGLVVVLMFSFWFADLYGFRQSVVKCRTSRASGRATSSVTMTIAWTSSHRRASRRGVLLLEVFRARDEFADDKELVIILRGSTTIVVVWGGRFKWTGRDMFLALRYNPHALQMMEPSGARLHNGVWVVPQFEQTWLVNVAF